MNYVCTALTLVLASAAPGLASETEPKHQGLAAIRLQDLAGDSVEVGALHRQRLLVLAYTGVGCPVAGRYAPRLTELRERYRSRGVCWVGVNANPQDSRADVAREVAELELGLPVLKDVRQELTRALDARTTTEVFVFDRSWTLQYHGAVDDQYSRGASLPQPRTHYLTDALDALLEGKQPPRRETPAEGCALTRISEDALPAEVTWTEHVTPILRENCQNCHRPGQVGPFSLLEYEKAAGWSEMILEVIGNGRMPPWNADEEFGGHFSNERSLTSWEQRILERWVEGGLQRGESEDEPAPKRWAEGWRLGEPDAVYAMQEELVWDGRDVRFETLPEEGFAVPRDGVVEYQYFAAQTDFAAPRWVRAIEVQPGAADVVHHVLVWAEDPGQPGAWQRGESFESYFAVAVPGDTPSIFPRGAAKPLPAGARLIFQVHYTPNGKERFDRSRVALFFSDREKPREVHTSALVEERFRIPPGESSYQVRAVERLEQPIELLSLFPHMHTRGRDFRYLAHLPDGSTRDLLSCIFDFNWQESYVFKEPVRLPAGTRLECIGHFDNSAGNPNNPDPSVAVGWGDQTFEEMFIGYYDWMAVEESPAGSR